MTVQISYIPPTEEEKQHMDLKAHLRVACVVFRRVDRSVAVQLSELHEQESKQEADTEAMRNAMSAELEAKLNKWEKDVSVQ